MYRESRSAVCRSSTTSIANYLQGTASRLRIHAVLALLLGALVLTVAGCGDDERNETTIVAPLSGDQEVPPRQTAASGTITVTVDGQDQELGFVLELRGAFSSPITQAHIHAGARGVAGPVILWLCRTPLVTPPATIPTPQLCPEPPGEVIGRLTAADLIPSSAQGVNNFAQAVDAILNGRAYGNVHTTLNPTGEIRRQIVQ